MIVVITEAAELDLVQIGEHIARGNRARAVSFVQELLIFYRVREAAIDIVHILRGAQDFEAILFPDGK